MKTAKQLNDEYNAAHPFYCSDCGTMFKTLDELREHRKNWEACGE